MSERSAASGLLRAAEVIGRPVVTLAGDRVAEVKDILFDRGSGELVGFTLRNPGFFGGTRKDALPIAAIHGLGDAAVMVAGAEELVPADDLAASHERANGDVLSDRIVTDDGRDLGKVVDVIVDSAARPPDVVGYEVEGEDGRRVLIPLPATLSVSGQNLVVPAQVTDFLADDLATLSPAVEALRKRLASPGGPPTHISGATGD
ncbi:MAG: PRC-barrel domain-containing protein [Sporichthyaceae bacterium]